MKSPRALYEHNWFLERGASDLEIYVNGEPSEEQEQTDADEKDENLTRRFFH